MLNLSTPGAPGCRSKRAVQPRTLVASYHKVAVPLQKKKQIPVLTDAQGRQNSSAKEAVQGLAGERESNGRLSRENVGKIVEDLQRQGLEVEGPARIIETDCGWREVRRIEPRVCKFLSLPGLPLRPGDDATGGKVRTIALATGRI